MEIDLEDNGGVGVKKEFKSCGRCLELQDRIMIAKDKYAQLELDFAKKVSEIKLLEGKLGFVEREKLEVECEVRALKQRIESLEKITTDDVEEDDTVTLLMIENKVLECEKNKAESEVEVWKVKCKDLELQVMELQKRLSAGMMKKSSDLPETDSSQPSIVRIEAEINANENKEDVSGTPPVNVSFKHYSDAGVLKGGDRCELKSRVRKGLNFASERIPNKKISPSTPGGIPPFAPIDISDSDDDLNTAHLRSLDLDRKRNARDEMELSSKDIDQEETNCYNMRRPNLLTPPAKRVRRGVSYIVSSESETENDDNIPIFNLGSKSLSLNDSCTMDKLKEQHTPRRRLTRLRNRESINVKRKCSYKNTENVDEDEIEEVDSSSEGKSLGGFIVSNSDVSESGPASNSDEISRDDCSVVSESSMEYDEIMSGLRRDMIADFGRYPELCMKAVCALYRQQTSEEQSCKATLNLNGRGFGQIHVLSSVVKIDTEIDLEDTGGVGVNKEYESCGRCLEVHDRIMIAKDKYAQLELDFGKKVSEIELLEGKLGFIEREKLEVECEVRALKQRIESLEKNSADDVEEDDMVTQLMIENKVLECEKNKAESEVEAWKVKCKDLEIQVMELQKRLSAGTMEKSSNLPSIVRIEAEINANENKEDVSGTPPVNVSLKQYSDAGVPKGGYKCELKSRVRKGLNFANERSPNKKISPSTPGGRPPFAPIDISDSDDDLNTTHVRSRDLDRKRNARDEMELSSKDIDQEETNCYSGKRPNLLTPRAKRVRRGVSYIVSSESESENDDNIPIFNLGSKSLSLNDSCSMDKLKERTPRRRLTRLRNRESRDVTRKSSYKNTENVDEDEIEEVDSSSEGESLGGFIVSNSDVSESGPASNSDEISRDDCSVVSESSMEYDEIMSGLRRDRKDKTEWDYEADMLADFGRSHELCMKAVCALYRQQTSEEQSCKATLNLNGRGFSQIHALSGSELAEFLTDGDPHGDVMKSVEELREFNPNGVELCRKYATHYSKQLFEIYKNEEDPHFHP